MGGQLQREGHVIHQVTEAAHLRCYAPEGKVPKGHRGQVGFAVHMQLPQSSPVASHRSMLLVSLRL